MIIRLILAAAVLYVLFWVINRSLPKEKENRQKAIFQLACYGVAAFLLLAVFTGKLHWIGAVFAGLLATAKFGVSALMRALPFLSFLNKHTPFASPVFRTPYIEVKIDLQHHSFSGQILQGPHTGRELNSLTLDELRELEEHYRDKDKRSYYLIRVLMQQGGAKFEQQSQQHYSVVGDPSIDEAMLILGLSGTPTEKDIIRAHRALIQKLHPDRGGNDYLASRVNVAKDVLLKHFSK
ncbi:hypothetical protein TDB9533_01175 [Thalassocella blandensis]|nr:hypothetical protein TDB9533_01175 [Thalassocella blandensis]